MLSLRGYLEVGGLRLGLVLSVLEGSNVRGRQEYVISDISLSSLLLNIKSFIFNSFLQIDMSKCMVSFIDWYLLRINASEREKIKVRPVDYFKNTCWNLKCILILFFNCLKSLK